MKLMTMRSPSNSHLPSSGSLPVSAPIVAVAGALGMMFAWALTGEQWIILAGTVLMGFVPAFVRWPVVSTFGLYVALVPVFDSVPYVIGGASIVKPVGMLAAAMLTAAGLIERRFGRPPAAALWWGVLIVWCILTATWAVDPPSVFARLPTAVSLFVLYLVAVSFKPSERELYAVCCLAVIGGAVAAAVGYFYGLEAPAGAAGTPVRGRLVVAGVESNPNALGETLVPVLALALGGFVGLRARLHRTLALGAVALAGLGIFISMSRGALLGMITAALALSYRIRARRQFLIAALVLVAIAATMPAAFYERIVAVFDAEDTSGSGRVDIWTVAFRALHRFGLVGAGLENFVDVHRMYAPHGPSGYAFGAHNTYLMVWVELGIVGLSLMLAALGCHLLAVKRATKTGAGGVLLAATEASCIGVLVLAFFSDLLWTKFFWLPWIFLTWAIYCAQESRSEVISNVSGEGVRLQ